MTLFIIHNILIYFLIFLNIDFVLFPEIPIFNRGSDNYLLFCMIPQKDGILSIALNLGLYNVISSS